jgi:hypothetical protein
MSSIQPVPETIRLKSVDGGLEPPVGVVGRNTRGSRMAPTDHPSIG